MSRTEEFEALRGRLFGIAYRMTGSVGDAEDACQDAWLRWQRVDPATVDNPEAYLVRVVTRLALDRLQSAQRRRETYVGPYLPGAARGRRLPRRSRRWRPSWPTRSRWRSSCCSTSSRRRSARCCCSTTCSATRSTRSRRWSTCHPPACRQLASRTRHKLDHERASLRRPDEAREHELVGNLLATVASGDIEAVMALLGARRGAPLRRRRAAPRGASSRRRCRPRRPPGREPGQALAARPATCAWCR